MEALRKNSCVFHLSGTSDQSRSPGLESNCRPHDDDDDDDDDGDDADAGGKL